MFVPFIVGVVVGALVAIVIRSVMTINISYVC